MLTWRLVAKRLIHPMMTRKVSFPSSSHHGSICTTRCHISHVCVSFTCFKRRPRFPKNSESIADCSKLEFPASVVAENIALADVETSEDAYKETVNSFR